MAAARSRFFFSAHVEVAGLLSITAANCCCPYGTPGGSGTRCQNEFGAIVVYPNGDGAIAHNVRLGAEAVERYRVGNKLKAKPLAHVWARCDQCGEGLMRPQGAKPTRCVFTPGCEGYHRPAEMENAA